MKALNTLLISSLFSLPIVVGIAPQAKADLIVCSATNEKAYVAKAWYTEGRWLATGWTHVDPGECESILIGDMRTASAYIYASNDNWEPWELRGRETSTFCLKQSSFEITNADKRCVANMIPKTFYRIVSDRYDYTVRLR